MKTETRMNMDSPKSRYEFDETYPCTDPTDMTRDGKCSRCGGCCSSLIPASKAEIHGLARYAAEHGIQPELPDLDSTIYLKCPFWKPARGPELGKCLVYEVRPAICRDFICSNTNRENAMAWIESGHDCEPPDPVNLWSIFGKTGIKLKGREMPYHAAPFCQIDTKNHGSYRFHAGRPVSLVLATGERIPPSLVVNVHEKGLEIFDVAYARSHGDMIRFVAFSQIAEVLTRSCRMEDPEGPETAAPGDQS